LSRPIKKEIGVELKNRGSLSGVILGIVFGLAGLLSGLYLGVFRSLYESGGAEGLPPLAMAISVLLILVVIAAFGYVSRLYLAQRKQSRRNGH
jgi:ABC-type antimicrobial peptide transport system permease subunit